MSREVIDKIYSGRKEKIRSYVLMNLGTMVNKGYNYKKICIVEGSSDRIFYSNISCIDLNTNTRYLWNYRSDDTYSDVDVGKDAVISSYNMIKKNPRVYELMKKCLFIIDRDYDGAKSMKYAYDVSREKNMCITLGHSYENFFLDENNIRKIFYFIGKNDNDILVFEKKFKQFLNDSFEFFRLKVSTIEVKKKGSSCYDMYANNYHTDLDLSKDIFDFKFDKEHFDNDYFNKQLMNEEILRMRRYINYFENNSALYFYNNYSKSIISNRNNLRGHEAMNFLIAYLRDVYNIILVESFDNELFVNLVKILDVNMDFVNGLGNRVE